MTSMRENKYPMIVRDDLSRFVWVYSIPHKYGPTEAFKKYLADLRLYFFISRGRTIRWRW